MNLKALITTLVLGSSSVAMARPVYAPPAPAPAPVVNDGQMHTQSGLIDCIPAEPAPMPRPRPLPVTYPTPRPVYHPAPQPAPIYQPHHARWVTLGAINQIADGAMTFRVGRFNERAAERFSTLKLQSEGGKSLIYRVQIQFANGRTQTVEINRYLNAANPSITIDLEGRGRAITKVTVVGRNARQSAYRVLAT